MFDEPSVIPALKTVGFGRLQMQLISLFIFFCFVCVKISVCYCATMFMFDHIIMTIWLNNKSLLFVSLISQLPLWYHWSRYSYTPSILLVWFKWHCSLLAQLIYLISWFCCQYQGTHIRSTSTLSRCSIRPRLCSRSSYFPSLRTPLHSAHLDLSNIISMPMTLQLFISFSALDYTLNIAHLKTTIDNVSAWMSATQQTSSFSLSQSI